MVTKQESIIELIKKLMALSGSSNPNEAALAAAKANELLTKYNLSMADVKVDEAKQFTKTDKQFEGSGESFRWAVKLAGTIAYYNFTRVVYKQEARVLTFVGKPHNVEVCEYLFNFLYETIKRLTKEEWSRRRLSVTQNKIVWVRHFGLGCVAAIAKKLEKQRQASDSSTKALIVVSDSELEQALTEFFKSVRPAHDSGPRTASQGYSTGVEVGATIAINPGLTTQATEGPKTLVR